MTNNWISIFMNGLIAPNESEKRPVEVDRSKYFEFMDKYKADHQYCPKCGSKAHTTTLAGYIVNMDDTESYKDLNDCTCADCGDKHHMHDRVASPNVAKLNIEQIFNKLTIEDCYKRELFHWYIYPQWRNPINYLKFSELTPEKLAKRIISIDTIHPNNRNKHYYAYPTIQKAVDAVIEQYKMYFETQLLKSQNAIKELNEYLERFGK